MPSGIDMMMQRLGNLVPEDLKRNIEQFIADMQKAAATINANQVRIETALASLQASSTRLEAMQDNTAHILAGFSLLMPPPPTTTHIFEKGKPSGNFITEEKFPQEMIDDVMTAGIPTATSFQTGELYGGRERSNNEE